MPRRRTAIICAPGRWGCRPPPPADGREPWLFREWAGLRCRLLNIPGYSWALDHRLIPIRVRRYEWCSQGLPAIGKFSFDLYGERSAIWRFENAIICHRRRLAQEWASFNA